MLLQKKPTTNSKKWTLHAHLQQQKISTVKTDTQDQYHLIS